MPWYKFTAMHGPGHQSGNRKGQKPDPEDFYFYTVTLGYDDRRDMWENICNLRMLQNPVGDLRLVRRLPESVRKFKVKEYRHQRAFALARIRELRARGLRDRRKGTPPRQTKASGGKR